MSSSGLNGGLATRRAIELKVSVPAQQRARRSARQRELEFKLSQLKKDYTDLHAALIEAAQVYRHLCAPHLVQHGDFEIASEIFAVRHVPGDLFTVEEVNGGVILTLGDICGKGLAAGMWTTHLVGVVRTHTVMSAEPELIVKGVNQDLCRMGVAPLASLFLARLDTTTGRLDYCSAGHPPALLLRGNSQLEKLSVGGPLLGVVPGADFEKGSITLDQDDILLACSDGILESSNNEEEEFGYERLEAQLRGAGHSSAGGVLFSVLGSVQDFAATHPLVDDMSLVVVSRRK